jgi:hypothetical protein
LVAGQTLVGLDACYSRLEVEPRIPGCCAHDEVPSVEDPHRSCCRLPFVRDQGLSSTTSSTPDVASAAPTIVGAILAALPRALGADPRGFRPIVERPPDRTPPNDVTVLLI